MAHQAHQSGLLCGGLAAQEFGCRIAGRTRDEAGARQVLIVNCHGDAEVEENGTGATNR